MRFLPDRCASRPADDPIFALNREATARRAKGEAVVNATVGAMLDDAGRLAILPSVMQAIAEVPAERAAGYAPLAGHTEFLQAVISDLLGGTPLEAQAVAVATPGGTGALRHAVSTFLEPGQALLTTSYFWGPYSTICDDHGRGLRTFRMFDDAGRFDVAALERALDEQVAAQERLLVILNDPCHNPTGYSMSEAEWTQVAALLRRAAERRPLAVLADIAYLAFAPGSDGESRRFLRHLSPLAEHALVLFAWSGSKAFSAYGERVGALVACTADPTERAAVRNALAFACRATWSNCPSAPQIAVARCITDEKLRARVTAEREVLRGLLGARVAAWNRAAAARGVRYPRYDGGFFVTAFLDDAPGIAARMREAGLFVVPQQGALRVALCSVAAADVPRLVDGIAGA